LFCGIGNFAVWLLDGKAVCGRAAYNMRLKGHSLNLAHVQSSAAQAENAFKEASSILLPVGWFVSFMKQNQFGTLCGSFPKLDGNSL